VSSATAVSDAAAAGVPPPSPLARGLGFFSGTVGLVIKLAFLAAVNALGLWAAGVLLADGKWLPGSIVVLATVAIDVVYLVPWQGSIPLKFLVPGTVFLIGFQVIPLISNVNVGFTNWSTGHNLTQSEAIAAIQENSLTPPPDAATYTSVPAKKDGKLVLLLVDESTGKAYAGSQKGLVPLAPADVTIENGAVTAAPGYELVKGEELLTLDQQLGEILIPTSATAFIRPEGLSQAVELQPTLRYDAGKDAFVNIESGAVYKNNAEGSYVAASGEVLEPGWRTYIGFQNFRTIFTNPLVRDPFLRVFVWTFVYAGLSVFLTFALGLFLAIVLNKPELRLQRLQRSLLVIPYAIPAYLSILVWAGLLNDDFGVVNNLLGIHVPWLFDPTWAKVSCVVVNLWLGFPYFFLVCTGALQAIPEELTEAARVDGATARQVFRKITLPLLLVATAPLLIASFAFNFNNFSGIYLLTGGGPLQADQAVAGSTDILISYTYKLAFQAGKGSDYGLAAAVSIIIFFLIATISAVSFWRTKSLENLR
jgi:arabinogalactan oligomer/maltooligosaccharide transport system permease protein